tara:strand:+ start:109 stop:501 length:393 start_codon:yes stop_codon:yes gene_type:complete
MVNNSNNVKSKTVLIILSYLFGFFGVDRMYLGCYGTGITKLLTFGGLGIWYFIDLLLVTLNAFEKKSSISICSNYVWEKASIEQAYYVSLVIIALFVLKLLFGTLWNLTFGNIFNNHVVVHHKEHLDQMY